MTASVVDNKKTSPRRMGPTPPPLSHTQSSSTANYGTLMQGGRSGLQVKDIAKYGKMYLVQFVYLHFITNSLN